MAERTIDASGVALCTAPFGDPADPPILLVMGIGGSMLWWDERFCRMLAGGGRFVVRYDHPDGHGGCESEDDRYVADEMQVRVPRMREYEGPPSGIRDRDEVRKEMAGDQSNEGEGERGELTEMASVAHRTLGFYASPLTERFRASGPVGTSP